MLAPALPWDHIDLHSQASYERKNTKSELDASFVIEKFKEIDPAAY